MQNVGSSASVTISEPAVMRNGRHNKRCGFQYLCPQLTKKSNAVANSALKQNIKLLGIQRKKMLTCKPISLQTMPQDMPLQGATYQTLLTNCPVPFPN